MSYDKYTVLCLLWHLLPSQFLLRSHMHRILSGQMFTLLRIVVLYLINLHAYRGPLDHLVWQVLAVTLEREGVWAHLAPMERGGTLEQSGHEDHK